MAVIVEAAAAKKAEDVVVMDLQPVANITDYFVICSGNSNTQIRAIADNIKEILKEKTVSLINMEADLYSKWVLIDYGDVVCHIFDKETRQFYDLEHLWADAKRMDIGKL